MTQTSHWSRAERTSSTEQAGRAGVDCSFKAGMRRPAWTDVGQAEKADWCGLAWSGWSGQTAVDWHEEGEVSRLAWAGVGWAELPARGAWALGASQVSPACNRTVFR